MEILDKTSSSMVKIGGILPDDVINEILVRLPVKSLVRFKSVSKTWLSLLETQSFISMHLNYTKSSKSSILLHRIIHDKNRSSGWSPLFSFHSNDTSFTQIYPNFEIPTNEPVYCRLGTCNGVVCIENYRSFFLCNPATKQVKHLEKIPTKSTTEVGKDIYFDLQNIGLGFSSLNVIDLKLVRIYLEASKPATYRALKADLFTLSSNRWTTVDWCFENGYTFQDDCLDTFFANSCHWRAKCYGQGLEDVFILCFNMNTDSFRRMSLPTVCPSHKRFCIGVFKECLSVISWGNMSLPLYNSEEAPRLMMDIWIMKEYENVESWTKLFRIGPFSWLDNPLSFWMEDSAMLVRDGGRVLSCNLITQDIEQPLDFYQAIRNLRMQARSYHESLLSIK